MLAPKLNSKNSSDVSRKLGKKALFSPYPKQALFLSSEVDELLYGGARGGGKTAAMVIDVALKPRLWHYEGDRTDMRPVVDKRSIDYSEYRALILRRTFDDIYMNFKPEAEKIYKPLGAVWREKQKAFIFPSGAKVHLSYCKQWADVEKYIGGNFHYLGIEELNQFPQRWVKSLGGSIRSTNPELKPYKRYTTNPGGVGHVWIKKYFVDRCPPVIGKKNYDETFDIHYNDILPGEPIVDENGNSIWYIPALVFDNRHLVDYDPGYVNFLKSLDDVQRAMWLEGNWDVMGGLFFSEFSVFHHVIDSREFDLDRVNGRIYRCVDYGYSNPFACLFLHVDPEGFVTVFDEIYETGLSPTMQAQRIKEVTSRWGLEEEDIYQTIVDPAMKVRAHERMQTMHSVIDLYEDVGIQNVVTGNNDRIQGWGTFKEFLRVPEKGKPYLVFSSKCVNCIETIPALVVSDKNPEDLNTYSDDHCADALRYALMYIDKPFGMRIRVKQSEWLTKLQRNTSVYNGYSENNVWAL